MQKYTSNSSQFRNIIEEGYPHFYGGVVQAVEQMEVDTGLVFSQLPHGEINCTVYNKKDNSTFTLDISKEGIIEVHGVLNKATFDILQQVSDWLRRDNV